MHVLSPDEVIREQALVCSRNKSRLRLGLESPTFYCGMKQNAENYLQNAKMPSIVLSLFISCGVSLLLLKPFPPSCESKYGFINLVNRLSTSIKIYEPLTIMEFPLLDA